MRRENGLCTPATFLHGGFDFVDVDLRVQQGGEVCRAGLSGLRHLQVVEFQPEVGVAHGAGGAAGGGRVACQTNGRS